MKSNTERAVSPDATWPRILGKRTMFGLSECEVTE